MNVRYPIALYWHDCFVKANNAASHRVLLCHIVIVIWDLCLTRYTGVVIMHVIPMRVTIISVRKYNMSSSEFAHCSTHHQYWRTCLAAQYLAVVISTPMPTPIISCYFSTTSTAASSLSITLMLLLLHRHLYLYHVLIYGRVVHYLCHTCGTLSQLRLKSNNVLLLGCVGCNEVGDAVLWRRVSVRNVHNQWIVLWVLVRLLILHCLHFTPHLVLYTIDGLTVRYSFFYQNLVFIHNIRWIS